MREVMGELGISIVYLLMGAGYITLIVGTFISHIV
jgi:hypothetical protein